MRWQTGVDETEIRLSALMRQSLGGDERAYRQLLTEVARHLLAYFKRRLGRDLVADAEDLVQETLLALHARRATYDTARPVTAWLHAIARYKLIDHLRRRRVTATVPLDDADALFARDEEAEASARLDVERALSTLTPRQRDLVRDVKIRGGTIAEAAAKAGMSETAAKVGLHRALRSLARKFGRADDRGDE